MDNGLPAHKKLLFKNQVLSSRLAIRDFFLKTTVREVYENVGQVLSLVRMQLVASELKFMEEENDGIHSPGNLVGQTIRDLRAMCKSFFPDEDLAKEGGFINTLKSTLSILFSNADPEISVNPMLKDVDGELKVILFKMIQDVLILIKDSDGNLVNVGICYGRKEVKFTIGYLGAEIELDRVTEDENARQELSLQQMAQLIKGRISLGKNKKGVTEIKIVSPLNYHADA